MKYLMIFILFLSVSPVVATESVDHSHDGREHSHILPSIGISHIHKGLGAGITINLENSTSITTGEKSPIINQPQSVFFNNSNEKIYNIYSSEDNRISIDQISIDDRDVFNIGLSYTNND